MQCLEDKALIGSLPSPRSDTNQVSMKEYTTSKANLNKEKKQITNTGKSSSLPKAKRQYTKSNKSLVLKEPTTSLPDLMQLKPMSGKKRQELANHLNLERSLLKEILPPTGSKSEISPKKETLTKYRQTYLFVVILPCVESVQIIFSQLRWSAMPLFTGVQLELVSRIEHGTTEEIIHTIKIHAPNSGMATLIKQQLSSMNLGVQSTSAISLDGSIVIQSEWKLKDLRKSCLQHNSTLPATSTQTDGIQTLTPKRMKLSKEDSK